ncbi:MAG: ABC transporter substrate-binding protein [Bauldia sp.]|uniref:ABC transporter substrate-binding protein n=1 Tax=Bauldia sp. TaxID=2575872 RepID=UPI001DAC7177|nr:ABC transporter substrate-binding protein [Bauldia sp.]MCB1496553.1 ABC transporter substrate-binding protein [Bauldia sp.]
MKRFETSSIGRRGGLSAFAAAVLAVAASLAPNGSHAQETVKFGVSLPITGDMAEFGSFIRNGIELAIDQANAKGGLDGKMVELVIEDSRGDPREAVLVAERFVANDEILLEIGDFTSSASMAAAPVYEAAGMAQISPTASHPDFSGLGDNMVRVMAIQKAESQYLARWAVQDMGKQKIATIYTNDDWGVQASASFADEVKALGADVLTEEGITPGEKDFAAVVTKIKNMGPDAVFIAGHSAETGAILAQSRRARLQTQFLNSGAPRSPELLELAGSAAEGIAGVALYFPENPDPVSKAFTDAYVAKYEKTPNLFAALGYDAGLLALQGASAAGGKRSAVAPAIFQLSDFVGVTGGFDYTASRDPVKTYNRTVVRDGEWVMSE